MAKYADKHMIHTDIYKPGEMCCEACAFGARHHAEWCPQYGQPVTLPVIEHKKTRPDSGEFNALQANAEWGFVR